MMPKTMKDLADFMDYVIAHNPAAQLANQIAVAVADAIVVDLAYSTPADTGRALSNWQVTLDAPSDLVKPAFVPSPKGKTVKGVWVHAVPPLATTLANAPAMIDAARNVLQGKQPGESIFISNNLEYIAELDRGSSEQAPAGLVDRARIIGEAVIGQKSIVVFGPTP